MTALNKQALREAAQEATGGSWVRESGEGWEAICCDDDQGNAGFIIAEFQGENATANRKFVQSANPATFLALLDELEAKDKQIAEMSALQGKPIAWESTTPVYVKFITDERYQRLRPGYQKWYKPYHCSQCAAAGKGEAS